MCFAIMQLNSHGSEFFMADQSLQLNFLCYVGECLLFDVQMLAESLLACHSASVTAGHPLSLKVFVSGRGRLEDEGAIALADAFTVWLYMNLFFLSFLEKLSITIIISFVMRTRI